MDLFRFLSNSDETDLQDGDMILGATSKMWVERYNVPGEFEIVAPMSSNLHELLPLGTMIGNVKSYEVMIVENHEITEEPDTDPVIKITGRSFVSYFEQRVVGLGLAIDRANGAVDEYPLLSDVIELQIANVIDETLITAFDLDDNLDWITVSADSSGDASVIGRTVKYSYLSEVVKNLLAVADMGIKTIRRNDFGSGSSTSSIIKIYKGVDRSEDVIFSWRAGELEQTQYLFTLKDLRTSCFVYGKWLFATYDGAGAQYGRRIMMLAANDLDEQFSTIPTAGDRTNVIAKMLERGQTALRSQPGTSIAQADISNIRKYRYRIDFNVGDIIRLQGNFGTIANMRITEYTEIEDETGESSHPTLSLPGV